ncbi:hypothetical protein [Aneurinibacillus terranovensis]|uniref:hypothetical protein n=1 Tax=Aneurinibacillus terranovensis TaxID=278991 RepID=UPI0004188402|nr:hypothetical protein [Aneurinibacillus terranovensis]
MKDYQELQMLHEKACWHEAAADDHANLDRPYGQAAAQEHMQMAQECWNEYGRLLARLETAEEWQPDKVIFLRGVILK